MFGKSPLRDLEQDNPQKDIKTLDVVSSLISNTDDNIEMKTEIVNPYALSSLNLVSYYLKERKQTLTSKAIENWIDKLLIYMVSHNRLGRKEVGAILRGIVEKEQNQEKLTPMSNLAKTQ